MTQAQLNPERITDLSLGCSSPDGGEVAFRLHFDGDKHTDVSILAINAEKFIRFLVSTLQGASRRQSAAPLSPMSQTGAPPIEARAIGYGAGRAATETLVVLDLGSFQMKFAVPANQSQSGTRSAH